MLCDELVVSNTSLDIQVQEFQVVASEFLQRLKTTGPGLPNTDLFKGLELLKKFQVMQNEQQKLVSSLQMLHISAAMPQAWYINPILPVCMTCPAFQTWATSQCKQCLLCCVRIM